MADTDHHHHARRGRPRVAARYRRSKAVQLRLTAAEVDALQAHAEREGMTLSEAIRVLALAGAVQR